MSCDAAASLAFLWLAATGPITPGPGMSTPPSAVAQEPLWWLFANEKLTEDGLPPFGFALFVARAMLQEKRERPAEPETEEKPPPIKTAAVTSFVPPANPARSLVQKLEEPKKKKPSIWDSDEDARTLLRPIPHLRGLLDPRGPTQRTAWRHLLFVPRQLFLPPPIPLPYSLPI